MSYRLELEPEDLRPAMRSGVGRRWLLAIAVIVLVMAGSAAGLWVAYRVLGHHGAAVAVPILRADERPVKVAPTNPGGLEVPDQDMYILNRQQPADSKVEQLLTPEAPLPRPAPSEPTVTEAPPPPPAIAPPPVAALAPPPVAAAPPAPVAAPAVAAVPPAPTPTAAPAPAGATVGGWRLQIGALRSTEDAQHEWDRLKKKNADLLGALSAEALRTDQGERGVFYRLVAGPIANEATATQTCAALKERKVGCILVKP
jgi:hypothetical protein